jgi:uncharacterized protein (TIGR00369 family)
MKRINPAHISALLELVNNGPYFRLLGMRVCALDAGYSRVELDLGNKHRNPFDSIHGGVYSSLIDTAAYWSAYCELEEDAGYTSMDLSVSNLAMIREGRIVVEGKSIKTGKSVCLAEAYARDGQGKLLAHGTSKMMILQGRQSIGHAVEAAGGGRLPPKYIG